MRANALLAVLSICACKKGPEPAQPTTAPTAPPSTAERDALWKLAPDGALIGAVVSPAGLTWLDSAYGTLTEQIGSRPELASVKARVDQELENRFGLSTMSLSALGWTSKPGAAVFFTVDGPVAILPVADRDKFLAVVKGTKGTETDTIKQLTCKTVNGMYACAKTPALLDRLGKGGMADRLKLVGARGEIEVVGGLPTELDAAGVAQLGKGSVTLRAALKGAPPSWTKYFVNAKSRTGGNTAGFAVLDLGGYLTSFKDRVPAVPIAPGVTADALVKSMVGPLTITVDHGATTFDMRVALSDEGPAKTFVGACDRLPPFARLGASVKDGTCHVAFPQLGMDLDGWVDGKTLYVGHKGAPSGTPGPALSPVAKELATGDWVVSIYGRGTMLGQNVPTAALQSASALNEVGFGVRTDGDVIRGLATFRTLWSNPDELVAKLAARSDAKAIADAYPQSPFASDFKAGGTSLMIPLLTVGLLFSVAIPAFLDDVKKSETEIQLTKLRKNLEAYAMQHAAFPTGTVGPSPAKPCCGLKENRCFDPAAWKAPIWTQLGFAIDEPHYYRYSYASPDGKKFIVTAASDLDCNGDEAEWVMSGEIDARGPHIEITPPSPGHY